MTLHNCQSLCPSLTPILVNTYRCNAELYVAGETILSFEGTTLGDPLVMAMYALSWCIYQTWYVDDASAGGNSFMFTPGGINSSAIAQTLATM